MASVQDHTPLIKELSERRQQEQDPQGVPKSQDPPESPRPVILEPPREPSPPRFSQLHDPPPENTESNPSRRGTSTTNPSTLVNHPGTVNNATGPATSSGGMQNAPMIQDRNYYQSASLSPDRRPSIFYDPVREEGAVQAQLSDDGDYDRRFPMTRASIPPPLPVFNSTQDGNGNRNASGPRAALRGILDWNTDQQGFHEPQQTMAVSQGPKTVQQRLDPTHIEATRERDNYKRRARQQSLMINGAIGLQVIVGAITTGVAAASTNIGSAVAVLGGISTALASYLAKARGSGEPEFSTLRARELSTFLREVDAFILDHGHKVGPEFDPQITMYREQFELIIKTEGESSTSGTGYASHSRSNHPVNSYPTNQQAVIGGRNFQALPPHPDGGNGQLSEKQQMSKNEKAMGGMV